jgi:hypothetical protein
VSATRQAAAGAALIIASKKQMVQHSNLSE